MAEVNTGSTDTADAVQKQLEMTENIQLKLIMGKSLNAMTGDLMV